ncbi:type 4 pilus major pilin [Pectobacterium cacticida]|uniref:type 4 pilus major pilin n=1 Tax=Pectobacterium cacticida TaxID=69221 RepID=UPI0035E5CD3E
MSLTTSRRKAGITKWLTPARGGNLKDAIIAAVVIAAIIILVFQLGTYLWGLYQNSATQTEVTTMLEQSRKLKSRAGYTGASMATLRAVNGIPNSVDRTGDVYYNRYGGTYALAPARTNGSAFNNSIAITLTKVSEGGCGDLAQMFLNAGESIYSVTIGSTAMLTAQVTTAHQRPRR